MALTGQFCFGKTGDLLSKSGCGAARIFGVQPGAYRQIKRVFRGGGVRFRGGDKTRQLRAFEELAAFKSRSRQTQTRITRGTRRQIAQRALDGFARASRGAARQIGQRALGGFGRLRTGKARQNGFVSVRRARRVFGVGERISQS